MRESNKLSAAKVSKLKEPGRYGDGGGLWLQVSKWGTKAWLFRYMLNGKAREMGLGAANTFALAEARERARVARQQLADGIDPISARDAVKDAARVASAKRLTFRDAAKQYIEGSRAGWKSAKHGAQWTATLQTYAYPIIGDLDVGTIESGHVVNIVQPIWVEKTETAIRVQGRIEAILNWATARGHRKGDNPARWKGHLEEMILPKRKHVRKVKHHAAMPYADLPAFMAELRRRNSISARALEFCILTATRTGETIGALWSEIDLDAKLWVIPAARRKTAKELRVPLSSRAVAILTDLPRMDGSKFVFPGATAGKPLSNMAMLELLRGMKPGIAVHGFRSTFSDWCNEKTGYSAEVRESALGHVIKNKADAAYRRGDAIDKRAACMEAWAKYGGADAGNVVSLRGRAS